MKINSKTFKKTLFICSLTVWMAGSVPAHAQIIFDDDVDDETPAAPIDGLLGLGIAAGALYGAKKLKDKKQTHN